MSHQSVIAEQLTREAASTNEEVIKSLLDSSFHKTLTPVFIIEALRFYSGQVIGQPKPTVTDEATYSAAVWHEVATEVNTRLQLAYVAQAAG